ncbi:flagellin [Cypionkella sp.]|uniref:flagellin n=1 Tax=Cypionkella sp. TaxID=2811411 RepID=UPI002FDE9A2F
MSSILTNNSAMVALQTMKTINKSMNATQSQISTGKSVATAKDNAAVWAISKSMESDVQGFKAISDSLNLGSSTISVARQASETVTDLLTQIKGKIVAAQESNVDRGKIQTDVAALKNQIDSVVGAAQFNGLNLVNNASNIDILSSLDRSATGVAASNITVAGQNLSTGAYAANDVFAAGTASLVSGDGDTFVMTLDAASGTDEILIQDGATAWAAGDKISMTIGKQTASYTVTDADLSGTNVTADLVAIGMKNAIDALGVTGLTVSYDPQAPGSLAFTTGAGTASASNDLTITGQFTNASAGGLGALNAIDVSTLGGAQTALGNIESLLSTSITAAANFGSAQSRIDTQASFVGKLSDALKSGIGAMVDADMEETSARLQALQVQQQLATQSLSMANQQPQNILSLFR